MECEFMETNSLSYALDVLHQTFFCPALPAVQGLRMNQSNDAITPEAGGRKQLDEGIGMADGMTVWD